MQRGKMSFKLRAQSENAGYIKIHKSSNYRIKYTQI